MKILYLDWPCFCGPYFLSLWKKRQIPVEKFFHPDYIKPESPAFVEAASNKIKEFKRGEEGELVFSMNFFPPLAEACCREGISYISFVYDSPQVKLWSRQVTYSTNWIFLFDRSDYRWLSARKEKEADFKAKLFYQPLPGPGEEKFEGESYISIEAKKQVPPISFVGDLYCKDYKTLDFKKLFTEKADEAYGNFEKALKLVYPQEVDKERRDGQAGEADWIYRKYYLGRREAMEERLGAVYCLSDFCGSQFALHTASSRKEILEASKLLVRDQILRLDDAQVQSLFSSLKEPIPYGQPLMEHYRKSRINLHLHLKTIEEGIPLRCIEILCSGGFLLTEDIPILREYLRPGVEYDCFRNLAEMKDKISYYLAHEKERAQIAEFGRKRAWELFSYRRVWEIIQEEFKQ